jgi:hypothetical protein
LKEQDQIGDKYLLDGSWNIGDRYVMVNISKIALYKSRGLFPQKYILYQTGLNGNAAMKWGIAAFVRFFDVNVFNKLQKEIAFLLSLTKC